MDFLVQYGNNARWYFDFFPLLPCVIFALPSPAAPVKSEHLGSQCKHMNQALLARLAFFPTAKIIMVQHFRPVSSFFSFFFFNTPADG